ncbi:MAG TPA: ZIP family metal transporter, partial [Solirubrobacteraceae bacterium]
IFVDVLEHALSIVQAPVDAARHGHRNLGAILGRTLLLGTGFLIGCTGLAWVEKRLRPISVPPIAGGAVPVSETPRILQGRRSRPSRTLPLSTTAGELAAQAQVDRIRALRRGLAIAAAIGLHNFAEGLAIGVSARAGAVELATVLIIGFALHNATEGFGIVGPLGNVVPSWKWLGAVGLVAGGPTFLGAMVGYAVTSLSLELAFYALAGGAILYVIGEVWNAMRRYGYRELGLCMLAAGFMIGVVTDLIVTYGGG